MNDGGEIDWGGAIAAAAARISGRVVRTEMRQARKFAGEYPVWLKLENRQKTGSFKLRGATNALLCLDDDERARGVTTASTGNHGRALAHAAAAQGVRCVVHISSLVPSNKVEALKDEGADIRVIGRSQDEAEDAARALARREGLVFIPPFDHADIIAGQGTIGLEILDDVPEASLVLVPLSGGGLAVGVAAAAKARKPVIGVIGVSMARGAAMHASLAAGRPVAVAEEETLADSLGGGIGLANRHTFRMARDLLDDVVLLSEDEIAAGIRAASAEGEIVEGAGAVGLGALLAGKVRPAGPVVAILSGGNIDAALHRRILEAKAV